MDPSLSLSYGEVSLVPLSLVVADARTLMFTGRYASRGIVLKNMLPDTFTYDAVKR